MQHGKPSEKVDFLAKEWSSSSVMVPAVTADGAVPIIGCLFVQYLKLDHRQVMSKIGDIHHLLIRTGIVQAADKDDNSSYRTKVNFQLHRKPQMFPLVGRRCSARNSKGTLIAECLLAPSSFSVQTDTADSNIRESQ